MMFRFSLWLPVLNGPTAHSRSASQPTDHKEYGELGFCLVRKLQVRPRPFLAPLLRQRAQAQRFHKALPRPAPGGRDSGRRRGNLAGAFRGFVALVGGRSGGVATKYRQDGPLPQAWHTPPAPVLALSEGARPHAAALPAPPTPLPVAAPPSSRTAGGGGGGWVRPLPHTLLSLAGSGVEPAYAAGPPTLPGLWPAM